MDGISVVLGASGGTGSAIVRVLVEGGHRVRAVNRGGDADVPREVERLPADLGRPEDARRAVAGAAVVYHAAQPAYTRWTKDFLPMNRAIADATAAAGAKLVFCDNLYMYDPGADGVMTEESPPRTTGRKSPLRARMADELLTRHREGRLRVTIGRSSDYFGPHGLDSAIGARLFEAALRGRRARWLGSLDVPHTASYLEDMGRAYLTLGNRPEADGRVWHLPAAEPVTGREFAGLVFSEAGTRPRIAATSTNMVRLAGLFVPLIRELGDVMYQWTGPFVSDWSAYRQAFGPFEPTSLPEAVRRTVAWYRAVEGKNARR